MPRIGVVIHANVRPGLLSEEDARRLESLGEVAWTDSERPLTADEAAALLQGCEIGVGSWGTPSIGDEAVAARCPDLRLWVHAAGSVKGMFRPHLRGRDVTIASCAPAIAENVAEMAVGELIVGLKRVLDNAAANRKGKAGKPKNSKCLASCTVGVLAASQVGRRTIRNLRPFGPKVLLYDPFVTGDAARELGVERVCDVLDLCRRSDAVTLHTPAVPATKGIIGREALRAMRDDCVIVNTSRGTCIDEAALVEELSKGRLFAFLDVTSPEPAAEDSPLRKLPNVVLTSHVAGGADHKIGRQAVDDVAAFIEGRPLAMAVTWDMLDRLA